MKKNLFIFCLLHLVLIMQAQTINVKGQVTDEEGDAVTAATVQEVDNEKNTVITDEAGRFSILVRNGSAQLKISSVGFKTKVIKADNSALKVVLESSSGNMNEVVVVGFAKQKKVTNTGSVSTVTGKELRQSPSASIQNALVGRLPGLFQQQTSGQPGRDAANIYIRGISSYASGTTNRPLIIVDDVEFPYSQLNQIDANEVESVSILKDASTTAIYGIKGANGVIIITTRRGKEGPARITFRSEAGLQMPTVRRKPLPAHEALALLKEQAVNQGLDPDLEYPGLVTDEALEHFRLGDDPFRYPNVNWYDEVMKKSSLQQRNNLDINGGTKNVRYFVSLGYIFQNGILKEIPKEEPFNNNYYLKRYNVRSNLDVDVYKDLSLKLDLSTRFSEINEPNLPDVMSGGAWPFWRRITSGILTPWIYPVKNPDGSYAGRKGNVTLNPVGILEYAGYEREYRNDLNLNLTANHKLDFITKGLSARGLVAYTNNAGFSRSLTRGRFPVYEYNASADILDPVFPELIRIEPLVRGSVNAVPYRRLNMQGILNYNRQFGQHNVYALALYNQATDISGSVAPANFKGYAARVGYNFKSKYLLEFNAGYNGTDRFKAKNRYGLFPAVSAGWNISEEKFFKDHVSFINYFKVRGSYGLVGSDDVGGNRYIYEEVYTRSTGAYYFGENPTADERILPGQLANEDVRWEKERKANIGADIKLFNSKLEITADYFDHFRYDILTARESVPNYTGLSLPPVNIGKVSNKGLEVEINHRNTIGKSFQYFVKGNFSYAKNRIVFRDEPENAANPLLRKTGRAIGQQYGYITEGFYYDSADIAKSPVVVGRVVKPGDLKYKDVNGDGKIDQGDIGPIGYPNIPQITYGFAAGFSYKGFDVSALFQGAARGSLSASTLLQIGNVNGIPTEIHKKRWTPETRDVAEYPRLGGVSFDNSTFWLRPVDYLRLKNVELGYRLPKRWISAMKLNDFRLYANALNLVTWFDLKIYDVDPESLSGGGTVEAYSDYPQLKVVNFGLQVTF
jgi:TonB-linked SusC/RagA family outer membrane protein